MINPSNQSLEELIRDAMEHRLFHVRAHLPARVKTFHLDTRTVDAEVLLNPKMQHDGGEETIVIGVVNNVPIEYYAGGGYVVTFPLSEGDGLKLSFHDHSLDAWQKNGGVTLVNDLRLHHVTDATAYPGLRAEPDKISSVSATKMIIGKDGDASMQITIDGTVIKLSDNATNFVALANLVESRLTAIKTWAAAVETAIPAGVFPAPASLATTMPTIAVAATKVKAQ